MKEMNKLTNNLYDINNILKCLKGMKTYNSSMRTKALSCGREDCNHTFIDGEEMHYIIIPQARDERVTLRTIVCDKCYSELCVINGISS